MLIGCARVSSQGQSLDRQIGALNTAKTDKIFREVASGRTVKGRPQLEKAIDALGAGDVLVIAEWDRVTRSMMDGIGIIQRVWEHDGHSARNSEPFMVRLKGMDIAQVHKDTGFDDVEIVPFEEFDGALSPANTTWRLPWAMIIARKAA